MIGFAMCGSYCTHAASLGQLRALLEAGYEIQPIISENVFSTDTRFGTADALYEALHTLCGREPIHSIVDAEPLGPNRPMDMLIICPCTGNTLAKIANGITDTPVCMASKAHLRSDRPLLITLASNDALSANLRNIGALLTRKGVYFTPLRQDDPVGKPHSLVADFTRVPEALEAALRGEQMRPLFWV